MAFKSLNSFSATVAKATTNELASPKQKHLDALLQRINTKDANLDEVSIPLIEKLQSHNWQTNYKAIITLHFLIQNGNEKFLQNISAKKPVFRNAKRFVWTEHNAIRFLQSHSHYMETKLSVYNNAGFDYCRVRRGQNGFLRTINPSRVFEHLSYSRKVMEAIIQFNPKENDLRTALVLTSFSKVFKDLTSLFQFLNEGIIILIERFFELDLEKSQKALEIYKFCLSISGVIKGIYAEAQEVGIDQSDYSSYTTYRTDMVVTMETHIKSLQTKGHDTIRTTIDKLTHSPSPKRAYQQPPGIYRKQQSTPLLLVRQSSPDSVGSISPPNYKSDKHNLFPVKFESSYSASKLCDSPELIAEKQPIIAKSNPTSPNLSNRLSPCLKQKSVPDLMKHSIHQDLLEIQEFYSSGSCQQITNKYYTKKHSNPFENGYANSVSSLPTDLAMRKKSAPVTGNPFNDLQPQGKSRKDTTNPFSAMA